ncbi:MAG: hypothetical protein KGZ79_08410 [Dethiobacter sp.]|jgi:hypothetical protein|nr:hypothetical protein [Dethiobacter sp.]
MEETGLFPDILALELAEAVKVLEQIKTEYRIVYTSPHGKPGHGTVRVIRQRMLTDGRTELTVSAGDWGKEV